MRWVGDMAASSGMTIGSHYGSGPVDFGKETLNGRNADDGCKVFFLINRKEQN